MPHVTDGVELDVTRLMEERRRQRASEAQAFPGIRGTQSILPEADLIPADREQLRKNRFGAFQARTLRAQRATLGPLSDTGLRRREGPAVGLSDDDLNRELLERAQHRNVAQGQAQARRVEGFQAGAESRRPEAERTLSEVRNVGETDQQYIDRLLQAGYRGEDVGRLRLEHPFIAEPEGRTPQEVEDRAEARRQRSPDAAQAIRDRRERRRRDKEPLKRQGPPAEFPGPPERLRRAEKLTPSQKADNRRLDFEQDDIRDELRGLRTREKEIAKLPERQRNKPEIIEELEAIKDRKAELKTRRGEIPDERRYAGEEEITPTQREEAGVPSPEAVPIRSSAPTSRQPSAQAPSRQGTSQRSGVQAPPSLATISPTGGSTELVPGLTFQQEQQRQRNYEALKPAQPGAIISPETAQAILDHVRSFHPDAQTEEDQHELAKRIAREMGWS